MSNFLEGGWEDKYIILHTDGRPVSPGKVRFVLNLTTDPCARAAMRMYAIQAERRGNPELARDIRRKLVEIVLRDAREERSDG